jgi:ABC-type antimicrobial peptide transport system permease subunit
VQQRTREIGIRLALGATGNQVRGLVISQGMRLAAAGVILGAMASLGFARYMQTLVYGVKPVDIGTILISSLTLGLVAAFASYIPAHRASRLDPATVLRST